MVRSILSLGILAAFVAGPAVRLECLLTCAEVEHAAATETCHSDSSPEPAFSPSTDHCVSEALPTTLAAKRSDVRSSLAVIGGAPGLSPVQPALSRGAAPSPDRLAIPPPKRLIPLRI